MNEHEIIKKINDAIEVCTQRQTTFCMPTLDGVKVETNDISNGTLGTLVHEKHTIHVTDAPPLIVEHKCWDSSLTHQMRPDKNKVTISGGSLTESIIAVWDEKN